MFYIEQYEWGDCVLTIVTGHHASPFYAQASRSLRNRMSRVHPVGQLIKRVAVCDLPELRCSELAKGWERNLVTSGAVLALGMSAL